MSDELTDLLTKINNEGITALDFVKEQTPEVISQTLQWGYTSNMLQLILCCVIIVLSGYYARRLFKKNPWNEASLWLTAVCILSFLSSLLFLYDLIKISIAPKVWLLQTLLATSSKIH